MRRRYVFDTKMGKLVELDLTKRAPEPRVHFITDRAYENLTPVVEKLERDKDGNVVWEMRAIDSRTKHREYMKEHGFALMDDFKETWAKAGDERAKFTTGQQDDKDIREALERAKYRVFDAPGIEERPKLEPGDKDPAGHSAETAIVSEYMPHGK